MKGKLYKCKICLHLYKEKKWAQKCRAWCVSHNSCNLEVIRHSVNMKKWHTRVINKAQKLKRT